MKEKCRMQKRDSARQLVGFFILHSAFFLCFSNRQFLFLADLMRFIKQPAEENEKCAVVNASGNIGNWPG
jgi:hypothetical protein